MTITYEIILTILNLTNDQTETFTKDFDFELEDLTDAKLYDNHHLIADKVKMFALFQPEIDEYCINNAITINNIDIDEFNINSKTDRVDVYFEPGDGDDPNQISLEPNIKCYVYPKYDDLQAPILYGKAYDNTTIIWSWEDDGQAHYLVSEAIDVSDEEQQDKIIAQIPIGRNNYTETGLESDTAYTRRLIAYNSEQTSRPSHATTVQTATAPIDQSLEQYEIPKNYDYTSDDSEREIVQENLEAFHSGVGDYNDLKVYKQMDADFYQKFRTYIQLRGSRTQREKRYDSVGFNYKVCLESIETVEEQKGEVTFDIDVYPRENISIKDYMYASQPVTVCARMRADVLLKKTQDNTETITCKLQQPEWKKTQKKVWHEEITEPDSLIYSPISIVFVVDKTKSSQLGSGYETAGMIDALGGESGLDFVRDRIEELIEDIETIEGTPDYTLISFDEEAEVVGPANVDATTFKNQCLPALEYQPTATCTEWGCGLKKAKKYLKQDHGAVFFFSDGGANTKTDSLPGYEFTIENDHGIPAHIKSIADDLKAAPNCDHVMACVYSLDKDIYSGSGPQHFTKEYMQKIANSVATSNDEVVSWKDADTLSAAFTKFLETLKSVTAGDHYYIDPRTGERTDEPYHMEYNGWKFKGWKSTDEKLTLTADWNIDECQWARVYVPPLNEDPWTITINDTITPIVYARNEQRAIIPSDSMIGDRNFDQDDLLRQGPIQVDSRSIQEMIMSEVQNTAAWQNGYNQLVEAYTDDELKQGSYIIRGVLIKDTYKYSDEDRIPDVNFADDGLEDGYSGTLNVYADINKLDTAAFGDDIYAVGTDKYVWVSGYTDAIIYDGEKIASFELNGANTEPNHNDGRDHQTEILISPSDNYGTYLRNRKARSTTGLYDIQYMGAQSSIRHVLNIVEKDKDIYVTGNDSLKGSGDWALFVPAGTDISDPTKLIRGVTYPVIEELSQDVIAHNDEHYTSPILNYRFNYTDPDAYTSYYELLPTCDPYSQYKNIVFLHIYYARNIYIQDENQISGSKTQYIESFGDDNEPAKSSPYYLNSQEIEGQTYFRDDYIDDYLWFQAKPMYETKPYYDEKPNPGMDSFYGNVNGRYRESNQSGKRDLRVVTPQFNLPTTIDANNIKIYIMITEFHPANALVSYTWEHPSSVKDSITNVNGDYVTFNSDSLTYKDVEYNDLLQTTTSSPIELFNNKTTMHYFTLQKPITLENYDHYYIELFSDNSDVLALNYPNEITFDGNGKAEFGASFKGVVNATTKWSPRIHNGYYYLNQHEYYAYSEFDVEADFEEYNAENYRTINGYLTINVDLLHRAGEPEHYDIIKNTRAELMQNEQEFTWVIGKGLTIVPQTDGQYYKEYTAHVYTSPVILFPNTLTSAGQLRVDYHFEDGSDYLPMQVRSYSIETGTWSDWAEFANDSVPNVPLGCAYQVQFTLAASLTNHDKTIDDYLCCYLDWEEYGDLENSTNLVAITDHLQAGPDNGDAIFNSKIIDYGCETTISLDMFASNINNPCELYVAADNSNRNKLLLENVVWSKVDKTMTLTSRYFRYRIVIPYGEKVYWLHMKTLTKESTVLLPYVEQIQMTGDYVPSDTYDSFQEIQAFEITTDGKPHRIFPSIYNIIASDVHAKGFNDNEIHYVRLSSTEHNIHLNYENSTKNEYPSVNTLNTPIFATADFETEMAIKHTPYIFAAMDPVKELDVITIIKGTPQQYCPITMEDANGIPYTEVFDVDPVTMQKTEIFEVLNEDNRHYIKLSRNDFDIKTLTITLNDEPFTNFRIVNNLIIFDLMPDINDIITIKYKILNSFYTEIDYENDQTKMTIYSDYDSENAKLEEISNLTPIIDHHTYTECRLNQIYSNGYKYAINKNATTVDPNWKYDSELNAIYYSYNIDDFSMIINNLVPVDAYEIETVVYSTDNDDDIVGSIIGYVKDSGGTAHTLSYLISLGSDYTFNDMNTAIVLDYGRSNETILTSKQIDHTGYTSWNQMLNGIKMSIKKTTTQIQCKISSWNDPETWNSNSILTVTLTSNDSLQPFTSTVYYGFCVQSQKNTYFKVSSFAGHVDHTITVEEQMNTLKHKYKVFFETSKTNNKFTAENLSLNPVYRTDYKGFIYLTDEHNEPYIINIYRNPKYIKAGGYDKIDIAIECLDYEGNPVISKDIDIDCNSGILNFDNTDAKHLTDMNGVIHVLYESAVEPCVDIVTARTVTSDGEVIEASVDIINE